MSNKGTFHVELNRREEITYSSLRFSGGEIQVKILSDFAGDPPNFEPPTINITAHLTSSDKIMELAMLVDALRRWVNYYPVEIALICPYLPYARQDRVCDAGESLALKVMCEMINAMNFASVQVWDVHSDVSLALLNNVTNVPPQHFVGKMQLLDDGPKPVLVAPDAGAMKKIGAVAKELGLEMVRADKIRSTHDGSITGTKVYSNHIGDRDFLIVDDICDGGRTFLELAKELKPLTDGKVFLYVTHGIFSKGLEVFDGLIDHIYCACPFPDVDIKNPNITVLSCHQKI